MAFFRRRKILSFFRIILVIFTYLAAISVFYCMYRTGIAKAEEKYEENLEQLQFDLYSLNRRVLVPINDIPVGTILAKDMFDVVETRLDIPQVNLLDETDMGKVCKISLPSGIPVLKMMVTDEILPDDLREHEFNMFQLQANLKKGDFIDVRIFFPTGENYIVLSKKQIRDIIPEKNLIRLWLNESEIHNISSAIIDAYIHPGTKIYITTYIIPELQEATIPFYAANEAVLDLMKNDPNIVEKASDALAREARAALERNLNLMANENVSRVSSGVSEELSKTTEAIRSREESVKKAEKANTDGSLSVESEIFN